MFEGKASISMHFTWKIKQFYTRYNKINQLSNKNDEKVRKAQNISASEVIRRKGDEIQVVPREVITGEPSEDLSNPEANSISELTSENQSTSGKNENNLNQLANQRIAPTLPVTARGNLDNNEAIDKSHVKPAIT